jgi:hypothetical protein
VADEARAGELSSLLDKAGDEIALGDEWRETAGLALTSSSRWVGVDDGDRIDIGEAAADSGRADGDVNAVFNASGSKAGTADESAKRGEAVASREWTGDWPN